MKQKVIFFLFYWVVSKLCAGSPEIERDFIACEFREQSPIEVVFSRDSHNRISWERGSVMSITGDSALFSVEIHPKIGQAFVHVLRDVETMPATLTVVSSTGLVQDVFVRSKLKPSTHVCIREPKEDEEECKETYVDFHGQTVEFLNAILENKVPFGYGQRVVQDSDQLSLPSPLEGKVLKALDGPFETVILYELTNRGRQPIRLDPHVMKREDAGWVFLNGRELGFREKVLCILGRPKEEV